MQNDTPLKPWELDFCPVTNLPILRKPEWLNQNFGYPDYRITFLVIGSNIIYSKMWGYTTLNISKEYFRLFEEVVASSFPSDQKYILIEDYSDHSGNSTSAKDFYTNYHRHNDRLLCMIFCTKSVPFKIMIRMGKGIVMPGFPVEIVDDYEAGMRYLKNRDQHQANIFADRVPKTMMPDSHPLPAAVETPETICPVSSLPITAPIEWNGVTLGEGYSVSFRLIGDRILHSRPVGNSGKNGIKRFFEERQKFLRSMGLEHRYFVEIKDYSGVADNQTREGRIQFTEGMIQQRNEGYLQGFWGYGASRIIKWNASVGTRLQKHTFPIAIVDNYEDAVSNAIKTLETISLLPDRDAYERVFKDEWFLDLGDFQTRFETLGDDIVYVESSGKMREEYLERYFVMYTEVLKAIHLPHGYHFRILNWKNLASVTWKARKVYVEGTNTLNRQHDCALSVMYGVNRYIRTAINVSQPSIFQPLTIENDLESALRVIEKKKKEMISRGIWMPGSRIPLTVEGAGKSQSLVVTDAEIRKKGSPITDHKIELENFSCGYSVIDEDILFYKASGDLLAEDIDRLFDSYERFISDIGLTERGYLYLIADWSELGQMNLRTRKRYIERFKRNQNIVHCRLYVVYGISGFFRTAIDLTRQFFPARLVIVNNYEDAVDIIDKHKEHLTKTDRDKAPRAKATSVNEAQSIDSLLQFIGEINWGVGGTVNADPNIPPSHPFKPLFEAISLVRQDFDAMIKEKDEAEKIIAEQNKFNRLRAEIWKLAAQKSINEEVLIQQLLNEIGPVFNVSRACFLRSRNDDEDEPDLVCEIEWCNEGIKPSIGNSEPGFLIKHFTNNEWVNLTPQSAIAAIPVSMRPIAIPVISALAIIEDLESTSLLPFRVDGKTQGWFSFDICRSQKNKPTITEEMAKIAKEMVTIVSKNVMQRRAEEEIRKAYAEMEQKVIERTAELQSALEAAEKANRAKDDFLSHMSHEIRTPLNGIIGFSQIIARSNDISPRGRMQAEQITTECNNLMGLINQLLDLAKIEAGKMEINAQKFSLQALMCDISSAFNARAAEKRIIFSISIHPEIPDLLIGDEMRLRQVLINLIGNSIKFTREGWVTVTVNSRKIDEETVNLIFRVIDTGIGISQEKLALIFESFTQADSTTTREYGGSGLGTTICRQLVKLMGGEIGVESEVNKGSTFWFALPFVISSGDPMEESPAITDEQPSSFNGARFLVVEDYPTNQDVAKYLIESANGIVSVAENGEVALEMFTQGTYDIILMDVQMPKMDGLEATREIRKLPHGADIPILGMTANVFEKDKQAFISAGMNDLIPKPLEIRQFHCTVNHWLAPSIPENDLLPGINSEGDPQQSDPPHPHVPLDFDAYVARMGGNRDIAAGIICGFIEQLPAQLHNIEVAIRNGDLETVDREAHSIKGGALNVFANDLMQTARDLEMNARSASPEHSLGLLEKITQEYERLLAFAAAHKDLASNN